MKTLALVALIAATAFAQTPPQGAKPAFEVATVKLNTSGDGRGLIEGGAGTGGRFRVTNIQLRQLIAMAYAQGPSGPGGNVAITGGPGWIATDRYDIDARPEEGFKPTQVQFQQMVRALLDMLYRMRLQAVCSVSLPRRGR